MSNLSNRPQGSDDTDPSPNLSRRHLLTSLPVVGFAASLPAPARADEMTAVRAVIAELENWQGWESSAVVCTKAFVAYQLRQALGMELPDLSHARDHLDFQRQAWESYRRTVWYERDQLAGRVYSAPLPAGAI